MLRPSNERRRRGALATDMQVGESMTLEALHGTGVLRFTLDAKEVGVLPAGDSFDSVELRLTISRKTGQLARVRVEAPETVRVVLPAKKAA
jgi:hypothetical protein